MPEVAELPEMHETPGFNLEATIMFNFKPYIKVQDEIGSQSDSNEIVIPLTAQEILSLYELFKIKALMLFKIHKFSREQAKQILQNSMRCPHFDRKYYAMGMCNHCYHAFGRSNRATACPHKDRPNYALQRCM